MSGEPRKAEVHREQADGLPRSEPVDDPVRSAFLGTAGVSNRWVARRAGGSPGSRLAVGHANAPEAAARLLAELQALLPGLEQAFLTEIGTALGAHGGPGTLVVAIERGHA